MAKRVVQQVATDGTGKEALKVVVKGRRFWQRDEFYNEGEIGVGINQGVLTITMPNEITSYAPGRWLWVVSIHINPPADHSHPHN